MARYNDLDRRAFLAGAGKTLGLATLASGYLGLLHSEVQAASRAVGHLSPAKAAQDEDFWFVIQNAFSVTRGMVNLNNGGIGASPRIVTEALVRYQWQQEDCPPYMIWNVLAPQVETIRTGLAEMFGCHRDEVALTRSASESLEILLFGLDLKPGDEVLTTTQDYHRMLNTLRQRQARNGVVLKTIKLTVPTRKSSDIVSAFEAAITEKTKVMLVSHQINLTGQILPVEQLCKLGKQWDIEVIVDGAHSFGQFEFNRASLGCDYFSSSLHKWLSAPKGTGLLFVKQDKIPKVWPLMAAEAKQTTDIRKFEEIGTHSLAPFLAIGEAMMFHNEIGAARKAARLRYLKNYWGDKLKTESRFQLLSNPRDTHTCAMATFRLDGIDARALYTYLLNTHRIYTGLMIHDEFQGLRISPHIFNTTAELDRFCQITRDICKKGLPA
jgi:isopenicillin-N epimerase